MLNGEVLSNRCAPFATGGREEGPTRKGFIIVYSLMGVNGPFKNFFHLLLLVKQVTNKVLREQLCDASVGVACTKRESPFSVTLRIITHALFPKQINFIYYLQ